MVPHSALCSKQSVSASGSSTGAPTAPVPLSTAPDLHAAQSEACASGPHGIGGVVEHDVRGVRCRVDLCAEP